MPIDLQRQVGCAAAGGGGYSLVVQPSPVPYQPGGAGILAVPRFVEGGWLFDVLAAGGGTASSFAAARDPDDVLEDTTYSHETVGGPYAGAVYSQAIHAAGESLSTARLVGASSEISAIGGPSITLEMYSRAETGAGELAAATSFSLFSDFNTAAINLSFNSENGPTEDRQDPSLFLSWSDGTTANGFIEYQSGSLEDGLWHHFAAVMTTSAARLFVDGVEVTPTLSEPSLAGWIEFPWADLSAAMLSHDAAYGMTTRIHGARFTGSALYSGTYTPPQFA